MLEMRALRRVWRDRRGVSLIEFALTMPMLLMFTLSGLEIANLIIINGKAQRLASTTADLVAQRGTSAGMAGAATERRLSEAQVYDILDAANISARPIDFPHDGRIVLTAVVGEDTNSDRVADVNRIRWQRFGGGLVDAPILIGCRTVSNIATIDRRLTNEEAMFHSQVTIRYRPLIGLPLLTWFGVPETITRTATLRGRGGTYRDIDAVEPFRPKDNCRA